ncbi:hypothetical protein ABZ793_27945 [Micromonospora sp. NPDC047465]|uniref:hypothetical protein n=1 Tax=Micromonospora sp. NPDC047465 TaxID=3154813 RepID=UPI0033EBC8A6
MVMPTPTRAERRKPGAPRTIHRIVGVVAVLVASILIPGAPASAAPCSPVSCVHNTKGSQVLVRCWDGACTPGTNVWLNNGYQVSMSCWFDAANFDGNYPSTRWFLVRSVPLAGRWLVHSSYVYNQTSVGHC